MHEGSLFTPKRLAALIAAGAAIFAIAAALFVPNAATAEEGAKISSFSADASALSVCVQPGTSLEDAGLPTTLKATLGTGVEIDVPVRWEGEYDADQEGSYTVTAAPQGYVYEGQDPPLAEIVVSGSAGKSDEEKEGGEGEDEENTAVPASNDALITTQSSGTDFGRLTSFKLLDKNDGITDGQGPFDWVQDSDGNDVDSSKLTGDDAKYNDPSNAYYYAAAGNDQNNHNKRVRSFDKISYSFQWATELNDPTDTTVHKEAQICCEFLLPLDSEQAEWDTASMTTMNSITETTENRTYDFDGSGTIEDDEKNVSCQVLRGKYRLVSDSGDVIKSGGGYMNDLAYVTVKGMTNDSTVKPVFTAWLEGNCQGSDAITTKTQVTGSDEKCTMHDQVEHITCLPKDVTVTAAPRYNVQIKTGGESYVATETFDFAEGNGKALDKNPTGYANGKVYGRATSYGVTLQLYNNADRGMKGIELPDTSEGFTFNLKLSTLFEPSKDTGVTLTADQTKAVAADYAPLVLSWGPQGGGEQDENNPTEQQDGRHLTGFGLTYAVFSAPTNGTWKSDIVNKKLNPNTYTSGSATCYNGGTWNATKANDSDTISVTVKGFEIEYPWFPNTNQGHGGQATTYYNPSSGVTSGLKNVGSFSGGKFFIVTPFYSNGKTVTNSSGGDITISQGTYICKAFGQDNTDGMFKTTVQCTDLKSKSIGGTEFNDPAGTNDTQMNQGDDKVTADVYVTQPGSFDFVTAWSKWIASTDIGGGITEYNCPNNNYHYDVLGNSNTKAGNTTNNGLDALIKGSSVAIGSGFAHDEVGEPNNRLYAADILTKFDSRAVELTGKFAQASWMDAYGWKVTFLVATKKDGTDWTSDAEMNSAKIQDLCYYSSLDDVPSGHKVVAYLSEYRPINNDPSKIKKHVQGLRAMVEAEGTVKTDSELVGNVYQTCIGGIIWRKSAYDAAYANLTDEQKTSGVDCIGTLAGYQATRTDSGTAGLPDATNFRSAAYRLNDDGSLYKDSKGNTETIYSYNPYLYRTYNKVVYNDDGTTSGHMGSQNYGDSLLVTGAQTNVNISVAQHDSDDNVKQSYRIDQYETNVDYVVSSGFNEMPNGLTSTEDVTVSVTLAKGETYIAGSAYVGGTYKQANIRGRRGSIEGGTQTAPTVGTDSSGNTTLTWTLASISTANGIPNIYYTTSLDATLQRGASLRASARIATKGDKRAYALATNNLSEESISITKDSSWAITKVAEQSVIEPGDLMDFDVKTINTGNNAAYAFVLDGLPYNGDVYGSNFKDKTNGTFYVRGVTVNKSVVSDPTKWKCYYTTSIDARGTFSSDYEMKDDGTISYKQGGKNITWTKVNIGANGKADIPDKTQATAIVWYGELAKGGTFEANVVCQAPQSEAGDTFINALSTGDSKTTGEGYVVERVISGVPWIDEDEDGLQDSLGETDGEKVLDDTVVVLYKKNTTNGKYEPVKDKSGKPVYVTCKASDKDSETRFTFDRTITVEDDSGNKSQETVNYYITATAKADGKYEFSGMMDGDYAVRFASSTEDPVALSGLLAKYTGTLKNEGDDDTLDSDAEPFYFDKDNKNQSNESAQDNYLAYATIEGITMRTDEELNKDGIKLEESRNHDFGVYEKHGSITVKKTTDDNKTPEGVTYKLERRTSAEDASEETWETVKFAKSTVAGDKNKNVWVASTATGTVETVATGSNGQFKLAELKPGTYRITEVSTVAGKSLLAEPIKVTLPYQSDSATETPSYIENKHKYFLDVTYEIRNDQVLEMPAAGSGEGGFPWVGAGAGLVMLGGAAAATLVVRSRKKPARAHGRKGAGRHAAV